MEAVPRLHMLWFALKSSPEGTSFANLKKYIAEFYQEDPEAYSKDVYALETLRNQAMHPAKDANGCKLMKRYYCQLHSLLNRFPQLNERTGIFTFTWKDMYQNNVSEVTDMHFEMAAVLFNIAASHTQVGASVTRGDVDGMKMACTHFQCAAWSFGELRERYANVNSGGDFMTPELLVFMQQVSYAQAQECILEKSLIDNRKPNIVAKVTAQIVVYYGAALAALLTGGDDGPVAQVIESSVYKLWKKYVRFKISYLNCILFLYQGQHAEEQQKMGERVTLYQAAWDKLEEARKESKGLPDQKEINESLVFTADVVEAKRKNAKNENEFIYHESVPELSNISAVQGANLVNGISFSVTDPEVAGEDIFARLVPMQAHEASSMYSEEKAKLLRKYGGRIEEKDAELATFMSSLTLDNLNINEEKANKIPQGIVDRCAALNANKSAIPDLIAAMSQLAEICSDVEINLKEISSILAEEERQEQEFQAATGVKRTPNAHITELTREFQKYNEAHSRAGESNDTLRKAMELHVNNLKILARPLQEIQQSTPKLSTELNTTEIFRDVKLIVNKVNEMKAQRSQFHADLRIAVNSDDITAKVIAHGSKEGLQMLFDRELGKHERLTQLIDQNLLAQKNILQALTESYAKAAPVLKTLSDVKHKRDTFFSSLAASYDVYEDLLAKSAKGLEFYKKLAGNVQKLLTRFKSARDVQSEERQQRLKNVAKPTNTPSYTAQPKDHVPSASNTPKLRDYLKAKNANSSPASISAGVPDASAAFAGAAAPSTQYIPPIRPNPLGSENPTQAACNSAYYPSSMPAGTPAQPVAPTSSAPNEPPPPYSLQQPQFYDPSAAGYTNPMYQQQQQNIAPPAYSMQASPNSQFMTMSTDMANMSLQSNYGNYGTGSQAYANTGNLSTPPQMLPNASQSYGSNMTNIPQQNMYPANMHQASTYPTQSYSPAPNPNVYTPPSSHQLQSQPVPTQMQTQPVPTQMQSQPVPSQMQSQQVPSQMQPQAPWNANKATGSPALTQYSNIYDPNMGAVGSPYQQQQQSYMNSPQATASPGTNYQQQQQQQTNQILLPQQQQPFQLQQLNQQQQQQPIQQQPPNQQQQQQLQQQQLNQQQQQMKQQQKLQQQQTPLQQQSIEQQSLPNYSTISSSNPNTQPLYVTTTTSDVTPLPATLQAPYVVNAMQTSLPTNPPPMASVTSVASALPPFSPYTTTTKHPGYTFNSETGTYDYNSGYHQAAPINSHFYGQYTSPSLSQMAQQAGNNSHTTDSENASKLTLATGLDNPIISHTQNAAPAPDQQPPTSKNDVSYYNAPYGYQSNGLAAQFPNNNPTPNVIDSTQMQPPPVAAYPTPQQNMQQPGQHSIYIQSGRSQPTTQTTKSIEYTQSPQASPAPAVIPATGTPKPATAKPSQTPSAKKKSSNIDLLTDIDFSGSGVGAPPPILPEPVLKPQVVTSPPASQVAASTSSPAKEAKAKVNGEPEKEAQATATPPPTIPTLLPTLSSIPLQLSSPVDSPAARKSSCDNISIGSDLSSLDHNFDWDSVSMRSEKPMSANDVATEKHSTFLLKPNDPFVDDKTLKYFHKEVERYEKTIESLNVKMLNGSTPLSSKWKELQDLLAKESGKRTTTIARLFPEKNRSLDCLPYDHARVTLEKNTDDYINAAFIRNLGPGCPNFIIAQTPQQNTINDFWSMIYSQKARTVICLHTPNEILDPFWPQELDSEMHFDDYSVRVIKTISLSHCSEFSLRLSMHGSDAIIDLSLLQIKTWAKSSPNQVIGIARNVLLAHQQRCLEFNTPAAPLIMNCLTGSERSELVAIAICAILATQTKRPLLINVVDVWYRICSQRQNALRDTQTLEESMQIVLNHAHDVLNKRGIMTSYQMKIAPQVASKEKEEIKDPLNELDPLWKLKQK